MHVLLRPLFAFFLHIGGFGLVILGVLDSSFFFLPFGNDLLLVVLVARHHGYLPLYVLAASLGSGPPAGCRLRGPLPWSEGYRNRCRACAAAPTASTPGTRGGSDGRGRWARRLRAPHRCSA